MSEGRWRGDHCLEDGAGVVLGLQYPRHVHGERDAQGLGVPLHAAIPEPTCSPPHHKGRRRSPPTALLTW